MNNIRLLDTTLRDGMYITDFYTDDEIKSPTIRALERANVEIIECGFLEGKYTKSNSAKYTSPSDISKFIAPKKPNTMYVAIIMSVAEINSTDIPNRTDDSIDGIRLAFNKSDIKAAVLLANKIRDKGYDVIMQPMNTIDYSENDVLHLITEINALKPAALAIVDSYGNIMPDKTVKLLSLYEANLCKDIEIDFHFHNNMQLAFANAIAVLGKIQDNRGYILDASIFGMGRGAGNLPIELIIDYLNTSFGAHYDKAPILEIFDQHYSDIYSQTPWGYNMKYYLTATMGINSFYVNLFEERGYRTLSAIKKLLSSIPPSAKAKIDFDLVAKISEEHYN